MGRFTTVVYCCVWIGSPDCKVRLLLSWICRKLEGELIYLSSDTLSEKDAQGRTDIYYRGRVRVDQVAKAADPKLAALELRPGMTASVDVRTGKRTVLHFMAKPILRGFSGALTQK